MEKAETHILPMELRVVHTSDNPVFAPDRETAVSVDLGLNEATGGVFTARRVRAGNRTDLASIASRPHAFFTFIYVLRGHVTLIADGGELTLNAHDAVSQAAIAPDMVISRSADFEFLEIAVPDTARARAIFPKRPHHTVMFDTPQAHVVGTGPRDFFDYRDLGVADATDGLIEVQIIRAVRARQGGTGWHWHSMAQLSYGLSGWALLNIEGASEKVRQGVGDAMSIPAFICHNASDFSEDYWALQLQIPAKYDTVQVATPHHESASCVQPSAIPG